MTFMNSGSMPFGGRPHYELSPEQLRQREQWMADEANRLIEARRSTVRPNPPATIMGQTGSPSATLGSQDQSQDAIATQLMARLAQRDRGNRGF